MAACGYKKNYSQSDVVYSFQLFFQYQKFYSQKEPTMHHSKINSLMKLKSERKERKIVKPLQIQEILAIEGNCLNKVASDRRKDHTLLPALFNTEQVVGKKSCKILDKQKDSITKNQNEKSKIKKRMFLPLLLGKGCSKQNVQSGPSHNFVNPKKNKKNEYMSGLIQKILKNSIQPWQNESKVNCLINSSKKLSLMEYDIDKRCGTGRLSRWGDEYVGDMR